jgi:hypothetical protein
VESNTQFEGVRSKYKSRKPKLESNALFVQKPFQLYVGNELKDEVAARFGIREIKYEAKGFSLNER